MSMLIGNPRSNLIHQNTMRENHLVDALIARLPLHGRHSRETPHPLATQARPIGEMPYSRQGTRLQIMENSMGNQRSIKAEEHNETALYCYESIVIGAGISGLTAAKRLSEHHKVLVLEKEDKAGGLIKCKKVGGSLYHLVGGHVFNTKIDRIAQFFWNICDQRDFTLNSRNANIILEGQSIPYPIENNLKSLQSDRIDQVIHELLEIYSQKPKDIKSFGEFLVTRFGETLCKLYFYPYNKKIWQLDPNDMALEWLDNKLPMPTIAGILRANLLGEREDHMVHSSFYYPRENGSQYIVDQLQAGLEIELATALHSIERRRDALVVNQKYKTDNIVYTGDVRDLPFILPKGILTQRQESEVAKLRSHGTTNVLCACTKSNHSWTYLPNPDTKAHRVINTGNFSPLNSADKLRKDNLSTCVVEFSGHVDPETAKAEALQLPGIRSVIDYNYRESTYVVQQTGTRELIMDLKNSLKNHSIYLTGRFAEWEYYNMDTAMNAALELSEVLIGTLNDGQVAI